MMQRRFSLAGLKHKMIPGYIALHSATTPAHAMEFGNTARIIIKPRFDEPLCLSIVKNI